MDTSNVNYTLDKAGNHTRVNDNGIVTTYAPNQLNEYNTVTGNTITNGPNHEIAFYGNANYTYLNDEHLIVA